jgi:hypothetical protein
LKKEEVDMHMFFDPESQECSGRVLEYFPTGPKVVSLIRCVTEPGWSETFCIDVQGKERKFYIPTQKMNQGRYSFGVTIHTLTKVSEESGKEPQFWLLTDTMSLRRRTWLFPIDAFDDNGEYHPLIKLTTAA